MLNGYRNGNPAGGPQARLSLLLVEGDEARADRMERHLNAHIAGLVATRCTTLAAARAYLAGSTFDAVCIADELPDGAGMALVEFCDGLGVRPPLFVRSGTHPPAAGEPHAVKAGPACYTLPADEAAAAAAVGRALRGSGGAVVREEAAAPAAEERDEMAGLLEALRCETGAVAHAINNPLTVIAGNAQFLGELARVGALDATLIRPVEDIEVATQQLNEALIRLATLRQRIAASLGVSDGL